MSCPQPGPCQVLAGTCDPQSGCPAPVAAPNGTACDDGNSCTHTDSCQAGACVGSNPVACAPADQCHGASTCDPQTGTCSTPPVTGTGVACAGGSFDYDKAGRLVRDHATTLTYDAYDQLRVVVPGPSMGPPPFQNLPVESLILSPGQTGPLTNLTVAKLNASGQAVGTDGRHALLWADSPAAIDVHLAAGINDQDDLHQGSSATGINASGTVIANHATVLGGSEPFRFTPPSTGVFLGVEGGGITGITEANAINASGQLAGSNRPFPQTILSHPLLGFRYTDGVGYEDLPGLGGDWTEGLSIDDTGKVYGDSNLTASGDRHAVMWDDTLGAVDLNTQVNQMTSPGWVLTSARASSGNFVFGGGTLDGAEWAYRLDRTNGEVIALGPSGAQGSALGNASSSGSVCGTAANANGDPVVWAFVKCQYIDLNTLREPASHRTRTDAVDINDEGDNVGDGTLDGNAAIYRIRLPFHAAGATPPALEEAHTYGYDGLRTSTSTGPDLLHLNQSQYWFTQDYTETTTGNREHYVRVGGRIVAKVTMTPVPGSAFAAPVNLEREKKGRGGRDWPQFGLEALIFALAVLGVAIRVLSKRRGWAPATAAFAILILTAASCEMFGVGDKIKAALWTPGSGNDSGTHYLHQGIAPGPAVITNDTGAVWEERRYESFGQSVDAKKGTGAIGVGGLPPRTAEYSRQDDRPEYGLELPWRAMDGAADGALVGARSRDQGPEGCSCVRAMGPKSICVRETSSFDELGSQWATDLSVWVESSGI